MYTGPDYETARREAGFYYSAFGSQSAMRALSGIPIREFNLEPEACIEAYRRGRPLFREMFSENVGLPGITTPAISYGHANTLGCELIFPEGGEVGHTHVHESLEAGIAALHEPVDFATSGMMPFYLEFRRRMQEAFPGEPIGLGFVAEGPLTSAYSLRGDGFFTDIFDNPADSRQYLQLLTDSIIAYRRFLAELQGALAVSPDGTGMADDIAAFVPPRLWPELVLPFWEQLYSGLTTGKRSVHVEDLKPPHLPFLEEMRICNFDPSISPHLVPPLITAGCRVPYAWRLGCYHCLEMSHREIRDFVLQSAADGASGVTIAVAEIMCTNETAKKVDVFMQAAQEAAELIEQGVSRREIGALVSLEGQAGFWNSWSGFRGQL